MDIKLIRNATLILEYAGKKFLIDPMLAEKGFKESSSFEADSFLT